VAALEVVLEDIGHGVQLDRPERARDAEGVLDRPGSAAAAADESELQLGVLLRVDVGQADTGKDGGTRDGLDHRAPGGEGVGLRICHTENVTGGGNSVNPSSA